MPAKKIHLLDLRCNDQVAYCGRLQGPWRYFYRGLRELTPSQERRICLRCLGVCVLLNIPGSRDLYWSLREEKRLDCTQCWADGCLRDATHGMDTHGPEKRWHAVDTARPYAQQRGIAARWCGWHATAAAVLRNAAAPEAAKGEA